MTDISLGAADTTETALMEAWLVAGTAMTRLKTGSAWSDLLGSPHLHYLA